MRPIKFRGQFIDDGEYIYGDLLTGDNKFAIKSGMLWAMVAPDSIAQLVGYDKNNKEVYEGDILLDEHNNEHIAEIYDRPNFLTKLTLKEQPS